MSTQDSEGKSSETPPTYHALSRSQRDHFLAVAHLAHDGGPGGLPNGMDIQRKVESLRETDRPSNGTTYGALDSLVAWEWVEKTEVNGKTDGYRVTDDGWQVLADAREKFMVGGVRDE